MIFSFLAAVAAVSVGLAKAAESIVEVDLTKPLSYADNYDPVNHRSIASRIIEDGWAQAVTSLRYEHKIRAQLVLEKGKIVHEYYKPDEPDRPGSGSGPSVAEHVHSVMKSIMGMIIGHMVNNPEYDIKYEDTLENIFNNEAMWEEVLEISTNPNPKFDVEQLKKTTLRNLCDMASGLEGNRETGSAGFSKFWMTLWSRLPDDSALVQYLLKATASGTIQPEEYMSAFAASREIWPIVANVLNYLPGGDNLTDALAFWPVNPDLVPSGSKRKWDYVNYSPLFSYITTQVSGMMPSKYLEKYFLPHLGLELDTSFEWKKNKDGMEYGWHGMNTTAPALAKFAQLLLQKGSNGDGVQVLPQEWVDDITTGGVDLPDWRSYRNFFWVFHWSKPGYYYCMDGYYGHFACVHPGKQRVYVQLVEDDPECNLVPQCFGAFKTDQLLRLVMEFSEEDFMPLRTTDATAQTQKFELSAAKSSLRAKH